MSTHSHLAPSSYSFLFFFFHSYCLFITSPFFFIHPFFNFEARSVVVGTIDYHSRYQFYFEPSQAEDSFTELSSNWIRSA